MGGGDVQRKEERRRKKHQDEGGKNIHTCRKKRKSEEGKKKGEKGKQVRKGHTVKTKEQLLLLYQISTQFNGSSLCFLPHFHTYFHIFSKNKKK